MKRKLSLALGGGGSKGNAHIGVLRVIEEKGYEISAIAGTSIGGLIAAVYLAGNDPDEIQRELGATKFRRLFRRGKEPRSSLLGLAGVAEMLTDTIGDLIIEDLPIPLALTAVDLKTGREVVLKSGPLLDAVLATIAVPGVFPPRVIGELELVDGGISNPVPVAIARSLAPRDPVVAVPLTSSPASDKFLPETNLLGAVPGLERISRLRIAHAYNVFSRSMTISSRLLTELRLQLEQPDLIIRPDVDHIGMLDRVDIAEVIELGEVAAREMLPRLPKTKAWWERLRPNFSRDRSPHRN